LAYRTNEFGAKYQKQRRLTAENVALRVEITWIPAFAGMTKTRQANQVKQQCSKRVTYREVVSFRNEFDEPPWRIHGVLSNRHAR